MNQPPTRLKKTAKKNLEIIRIPKLNTYTKNRQNIQIPRINSRMVHFRISETHDSQTFRSNFSQAPGNTAKISPRSRTK